MANSRAADNIGTLSVDIVGDLSKLDAALTEVESKLKNVKTGASIKFDIPQAQITRLQKTVDLIERLQKTGVPDLSGLSALGSAPAGGRGSAVSGKANVNVSLKEADLTKLFRTAAEAAFATPIPGVKLDLDLAHIQQQLSGLRISFTGGVNSTQAAPPPTGPRPTPAGIREEIKSDKVKGAIDDMFTAVNVALKRSNQPMLQASNDVASKFTALADALGDTMHKVVSLGDAEGPYGRPVSGGSINNLLSGAADDVADKLEEAGRTFYERVGKTGLFQAYRQAGGQPAPGQVMGGHAAGQTTASQQQQVQLAQLRAAEETTAVARRQNTQMAEGSRSAVPKTIDDINNFARQIAKLSGYDVSRATGNQTRPWEDIQREFVAGRRSYGPQGMTAFGRVATSQGTDITDLLMAAGPGARMLEGFGEVMEQGRRSGKYISLTPEQQEYLKTQTKRQGSVAGHALVQHVAPREMFKRLLLANRGVGGEESNEITQWAMRAGGPLNASGRGDVSGVSLSAMMSSGSATITNEARDQLRMQRLETERRDLMTQLAGTGVPSEQRSLRAKIANRAGQINRLQLINAGGGVTGEQNRQMIAEGYGQGVDASGYAGSGQGELLGIDPLSKTGVRLADRRSIVTALTNLSQFKGEQDEYQKQVENTRNQLLGGYLPMGQATQVGGMTGTWTQGQALFSEIKRIVNEFRDSIDLPPTKRQSVKSMTGQLEREGFPMESAAISALFGEASSRRTFAEQAISSYPQKSGKIEGKDIGIRMSRRRSNMQTQYDRLAREYETTYGRTGSAEHDPMASGMPGGAWDRAGILGEKGPQGAHPLRLQPIGSVMPDTFKREFGGKVKVLENRIQAQVAREMGVKFGTGEDAGKPILPNSGAVTEAAFKDAVKARQAANPELAELMANEKAQRDRLGKMRSILRRHPEQAYFRRPTRDPATGELLSQPEDPMTGDQMRMRYYEASGMAPMGGVPLSGADIRERAKRGQFGPMGAGMPALTLPGGGSQLGPTIIPPDWEGGDDGPGGPSAPMGGGSVVHVWIDGPFPLAVMLATGSAGAIEGQMRAGNTAGAQALNRAVEEARGGWENPPAGRRVNLDEMRAAESAGAAAASGTASAFPQIRMSRQPGSVDTFSKMRRASQGGVSPDVASWLSTLTPEQRQQVVAGISIAKEPRSVRSAAQKLAEEEDKAGSAAGTVASASFSRAASRLRALGVNIDMPGRGRADASFGGDDAVAAETAAILRRQQGMLGQRAFGPTVTSAVMNKLAGLPAFQQPRLLPLPTTPIGKDANGNPMRSLRDILGTTENPNAFEMPGDPFSRINLARREQSEAQRLTRTQAGSQLRLDQQTAMRDELKRGIKEARAGGTPRGDLMEPLRALREMDKQIDTTTQALAKDTRAATEHAAASSFLAKNATSAGDVFANLAQGFVGGIAAGLIAPLAPMIAGALLQTGGTIIGEIFKPAYEAAIGYQNVTNKVIDSISDQVRANNGLVQGTVALKSAQSGLGMATYMTIRPQLEQAAGIEAGNKAYGDYINLIRAGERAGNNRGLYNTTNGLNILGMQTPFFGTPSTLENFTDQFKGAAYNTGGIWGTQTSSNPIDRFFGGLKSIGSVVPAGMAMATGDIEGLKRIIDDVTGAGIADKAVNNINSTFDKTQANFQARRNAPGSTGNAAFVEALERAGVDNQKIQQVRGLGLEFTDRAGKVITDLDMLDGALRTWTENLAKLDPSVWLESQVGPSGGITASIFGLRQQADLSRQQAFGQVALRRIAQPPVRLDQILSGMTGVPSQFQRPGPGSAPNPAFMSQFQAVGNASIQRSIGAIDDPAAQQNAQQLLGIITQAGQEMHNLQVEAGRIQMASMFRAMTHDISMANRQVSDLVGLTGKQSATLQDGTTIQASDIGILERKNMLLSRSLQLQQFEHQARSLNYQIALAGFMAEGATGEERAARLEVAQKEAEFQKSQLQGQKELANNNWQVQQEQNSRAFTDAMYQANELVKRLDDTSALQRIDDKIAQWQEVSGAASEIFNTYIQQGNGMIQIAQGVAVQLLQMGTTAAQSIDMATGALVRARIALDTGLPAPLPEDNRPWWQHPGDVFDKAGGGVTASPLAQGQGVSVQISNPSAGVDTQALVRVVISELNRQAGLRGLTTVGGR